MKSKFIPYAYELSSPTRVLIFSLVLFLGLLLSSFGPNLLKVGAIDFTLCGNNSEELVNGELLHQAEVKLEMSPVDWQSVEILLKEYLFCNSHVYLMNDNKVEEFDELWGLLRKSIIEQYLLETTTPNVASGIVNGRNPVGAGVYESKDK